LDLARELHRDSDFEILAERRHLHLTPHGKAAIREL
jgi:hypothetical protein